MKEVRIDRYGEPAEVVRCVQVPDVGAPAAGEVVFDVLLFPINPADLAFCKGQYRLRPPLPATPGAECVGRVTAVGAGVTRVAPGDLVVNLQRENWTQRRRVPERDVVKLPADIDLRQAAMLRINPPTALLLLTDLVALQPGEWVLQNVANSSVGRTVIRLAKARGWRTVNVVRRESLFAELKALGADACVVDGPDLPARVAAATGGAPIRLALEAIGGEATRRMAQCLVDDRGVVAHYGAMSGEEPFIARHDLLYRGVTLAGFMLGRFLARRTPDQVQALYAELAGDLVAGRLDVPVEQVFPIEAIGDAVARASQGERGGKILVAPNGAI